MAETDGDRTGTGSTWTHTRRGTETTSVQRDRDGKIAGPITTLFFSPARGADFRTHMTGCRALAMEARGTGRVYYGVCETTTIGFRTVEEVALYWLPDQLNEGLSMADALAWVNPCNCVKKWVKEQRGGVA